LQLQFRCIDITGNRTQNTNYAVTIAETLKNLSITAKISIAET